jgi:predicted dehydrogenase
LKTPSFPIRTAIVGIGGFGACHHEVFEALESHGDVRVVATCDPGLDHLGTVCEARGFARRGVATHKDFDEMLQAASLDLGVVAAPIPFHALMHEALVRKRIPCYLEKPPTLDPEEFLQMLAVEERALVPTNVGFSYVYLAERLALKRRMLAGEFGALKRLSLLGLAPRASSYFERNDWAGKLVYNNQLLLDSCLGNAMSHLLNSLLFFGGTDLQEWARPVNMACELYRANPIEGTDTIFATGHLLNGVEFRIAASHASPEHLFEEKMEFEHATITIRTTDHVSIRRTATTADSPPLQEEAFTISRDSLSACVGHYFDFLRGAVARPAQTLRDCHGFVETNALFYLAAKQIHDVPPNALSQLNSVTILPDVESAGRRLIADALLPSQAGYSWAKPGGKSAVKEMPHLRTRVLRMQNSRKCALYC